MKKLTGTEKPRGCLSDSELWSLLCAKRFDLATASEEDLKIRKALVELEERRMNGVECGEIDGDAEMQPGVVRRIESRETLRDRFAMVALMGMDKMSAIEMADKAYKVADAMLAERK